MDKPDNTPVDEWKALWVADEIKTTTEDISTPEKYRTVVSACQKEFETIILIPWNEEQAELTLTVCYPEVAPDDWAGFQTQFYESTKFTYPGLVQYYATSTDPIGEIRAIYERANP